ncbi:alpha/beta hydrolase [Paenibacillus sacheonensis]|uniref:Esterase family protein n=1 Tax=Paenibacillus sacheonensis TaxID=742054 RepID=A0A7X4YKR6_9BACL|nr:alpha/beta hydrolase-fold protein [Paenibacillus sacheonensis]MBM7563346.1 enterochelin esterase-like enzyme [Paenibacillus sacheonensis]NBC68098.1 esterase family protein [Paenibacillus sacheonensis]
MTDERYLKRTIVKEVVSSRYLPEGSRNLRVYLPPGYNELLSYPVVYCQDGEQFFNFGRIATTANQLILDEGIEPFIIVGVDVDLQHRTSEYAPNGDRHQAYVSFFGEELIPFIEDKYPIRRESESRILAGDSLGGSVSFLIALAFPNLFHQIISLSGAYYPATRKIAEETGDLSALVLYMIVGLQETAFKSDHGVYDFVEMNRDMRAILERKGASTIYGEHDGDHVWGFWQPYIPEALRSFLQSES